jgi:hypothetical protein
MVIPILARRQTEMVGAPSLTLTGTSGQIPHSTVAVPSATLVADNIATLALDGNIEMTDFPPIKDPETRMDQDAATSSSGP